MQRASRRGLCASASLPSFPALELDPRRHASALPHIIRSLDSSPSCDSVDTATEIESPSSSIPISSSSRSSKDRLDPEDPIPSENRDPFRGVNFFVPTIPPSEFRRSVATPFGVKWVCKETGLEISSRFDSGNLYCIRLNKERSNLHSGPPRTFVIEAYLVPDCGARLQDTGIWFHFSVSHARLGDRLVLSIHNVDPQSCYSKYAISPVVRIPGPDCEPGDCDCDCNENGGRGTFHFVPRKFVVYTKNTVQSAGRNEKRCRVMTLSYIFLRRHCERSVGSDGSRAASGKLQEGEGEDYEEEEEEEEEGEEGEDRRPIARPHYFSSFFPYSYWQLQRELGELETSRFVRAKNVFFRRCLLCETPEGRRVEMLIVSSRRGLILEAEEEEEEEEEGEQTPVSIPFDFDKSGKKILLIASRCHPGETSSSYVSRGMLRFLLEMGKTKDPRAAILRKKFVFCLVPMLNPDGVVRGHSRYDALGTNLNRVYDFPDREKHPNVYFLKEFARKHAPNLGICLDLHGHFNMRGSFCYGNLYDDAEDQARNVMFALLMQMNCRHFQMKFCSFSRPKCDHRGKSFSKTLRAQMFALTGVPSFTIETSMMSLDGIPRQLGPMCCGGTVRRCPCKFLARDDRHCFPAERNARDTPLSWGGIGRSIAVSILDFLAWKENPFSRVLAIRHDKSFSFYDESFDEMTNLLRRLVNRLLTGMDGNRFWKRPVVVEEGAGAKEPTPVRSVPVIPKWNRRGGFVSNLVENLDIANEAVPVCGVADEKEMSQNEDLCDS